MADYSKKEIELLKRRICPDCHGYNLREEDNGWVCEGANGLGTSGCLYFIGNERYIELTK